MFLFPWEDRLTGQAATIATITCRDGDAMGRPHRDFAVATGRGATVSVRDYPAEGPAVVLLHGAGLNLALWEPLVGLLEGDYHVVAIDFLGHGESTLPGTYSLHADLAAVEAVIETLGLERPVIIGHSYGGILAIEYAATHPECPLVMNLDGLGGQGRPDHYPGIPREDVQTYWDGRLAFIDAVLPVDDGGDEAWRDQQVAELLAQEPDLIDGPATALVARSFQPGAESDWERRPTRPFMLALLNTLFQLDVFSAYHRARCPVVVVVATKARADEAEFATFLDAYHEGLQAAVSTNELVRQETVDSGHAIPLEQPGWLADLIRQAVDRPAEPTSSSARA